MPEVCISAEHSAYGWATRVSSGGSVAADGGLGPVSALGRPGQRIERKIGALAQRRTTFGPRAEVGFDQAIGGEPVLSARMAMPARERQILTRMVETTPNGTANPKACV